MRKSVAPGVQREDHPSWGVYWLYGTKEALVASGLVKVDWFVEEGQKDARGRNRRGKTLVVDGRDIETVVPAKGPCKVRIGPTEAEREECNARYIASKREEQEKTLFNVIATHVQRELESLPSSREAFRERIKGEFSLWVENGVSKCRGWAGYGLAPDVLEQFEEAVSEIAHILNTGRIVFNRADREKYVFGVHRKLAEADPTFRNFLSTVSNIDPQVQ